MGNDGIPPNEPRLVDGIPDHGLPTIEIPRLDFDDPETARFVERSQPFVTRVPDWKARQWTPDYIREKVGSLKTHVFTKSGEKTDVTIRDWYDAIDDPQGAGKKYALQNAPKVHLWHPVQGRLEEFDVLLRELELPHFVPKDRLTTINVWYVNRFGRYYDNRSHAEPNGVANFNVQIRGKKHLWLFPPTDCNKVNCNRLDLLELPLAATAMDAYEATDDYPQFAQAHCYETILEEGDGVFIPSWWFHWFVHYPVKQMNLNYWWLPPQFQLTPIAADWAYINAIANALGGFESFAANFAKLPAETKNLLKQIEDALLQTEGICDPKAMAWARSKYICLNVEASVLETKEEVLDDTILEAKAGK